MERCSHFGRCGGCAHLDMEYPAQLAEKQRRVEALLGRFCKPAPILGMECPYHYRNKAHLAVDKARPKGAGKKRGITAGIYQRGTHAIIPARDCLLESQDCADITAAAIQAAEECRLQPFDEDTGRGFLRHVLARCGNSTGQKMAVLVAASGMFPAKSAYVSALRRLCPDITTIVLNVNPRKTNAVLGTEEKTLFGPGYIEDKLCGLTFRISARSFYQVNPVQTEVLYGLALDMAGLTGKEAVVDAYCGIGTIGLSAAGRAGQVVGVELNRDAVRDAIANARLNKLKNARFYAGDAGEFMREMAKNGEKADVVFLDPPRAGSDETFLASLCTMAPKRAVYISCCPETLARDLKFMTAHGYKVHAIRPVDMFPHTEHVEVCVELRRI